MLKIRLVRGSKILIEAIYGIWFKIQLAREQFHIVPVKKYLGVLHAIITCFLYMKTKVGGFTELWEIDFRFNIFYHNY